jgi:hypothetical protein
MKTSRTSIPQGPSIFPSGRSHLFWFEGHCPLLRIGRPRQSLQENAPSLLQNGLDALGAVALPLVVSELTWGVEQSGWLPNLARRVRESE